jgi:predicted alpha/beta hydrolase family esterase
MATVLILPGIGGSGPEHWQTRWEQQRREYRRVQMPDWDRPDVDVWVSELEAAVAAAPAPAVVVAHSLGCLALAHYCGRGGRVAAALLVAVPDPAGPEFPAVARTFADFPRMPLGFPSRVVASRDDSYGSFEFAQGCARDWGSAFTDVGAAGHINAESGLGDWPAGQALLAGLLV